MRPTLRCLLLILLGLPVAVLPILFGDHLWTYWVAYVGIVLLLTGLDGVLILRRRHLAVEVGVPPRIYVGDTEDASIDVSAPPAYGGLAIQWIADLEGDVVSRPPARALLDDDGEARAALPLVPLRRGRFEVARVWLRWRGPLGLVAQRLRHDVHATVDVVPNVRRAQQIALELLRRRDTAVGHKVVRHIGEGSEFEALREYVPGLDPRAMNWKASARHRKLINQEYRAERNHQVVVAVDTGHLMREPVRGIPKLDHALTAALVLSYTALRTGDRVGAYAFDATPRAFLEPRGGVRNFERILRASADLAYSTAETNFTLGLTELATRLRRRSFVVLLTDFVDTVTAELMIDNLGRLARRHLVTFVALRDPGLDDLVSAPPETLGNVYRAVVADDFIRERELVLQRLRRRGVFCIDAGPDEVSVPLVNRYLDAKRRELV